MNGEKERGRGNLREKDRRKGNVRLFIVYSLIRRVSRERPFLCVIGGFAWVVETPLAKEKIEVSDRARKR